MGICYETVMVMCAALRGEQARQLIACQCCCHEITRSRIDAIAGQSSLECGCFVLLMPTVDVWQQQQCSLNSRAGHVAYSQPRGQDARNCDELDLDVAIARYTRGDTAGVH